MLSRTSVKTICDTLDFSRPVVIVGLNIPSLLVQEIVARMSPTSRLIVFVDEKKKEEMQTKCVADERIEIFIDSEDHRAILHDQGVKVVDAIVETPRGGVSHMQNAIPTIEKSFLRPGGARVSIMPLYQAWFVRDNRNDISKKILWLNIPPVAFFASSSYTRAD